MSDSNKSDIDVTETLVRAALVPSLDTHEERPPVSDDYIAHKNNSLKILNQIIEAGDIKGRLDLLFTLTLF